MLLTELKKAVRRKDVDKILKDFCSVTFRGNGAEVYGPIRKNRSIFNHFQGKFEAVVSGLHKITIHFEVGGNKKYIAIYLSSDYELSA